MLRINKIMVPVDFSSHARKALKSAIGLARRTGADVHVFYAELLHMRAASQTPFEELRAFVERVTATPEDKAHPVSFIYAVDRDVVAAPAILRYADDEDVDLIIMGTHGRRGVRRMLLGSVAREVVQLATQPVLTVNEQSMESVKTILVPIDFSESSREALRQAKHLAAFYGAALELLHVVEDTFHPAFYGPRVQSIYDLEPDIEAQARAHMKVMYEETDGPTGPVVFDAVPGKAAQEIAAYVGSRHDLIVMATHGLTGVAHFFMGSVAERVVRTAPCPVFIVKTFAKSLIKEEGEVEAVAP